MAAIENERDLILQATVPRVLPVLIPIDKIEGLPEALKSLRIKSTATTFIGTSGTTNPSTITLTAEKLGGLTGSVTWSVITGSGTITPSGDTCVVTGSSVTGYSITIRARVTVAGTNYDAQMTLTKLGRLSEQERVNLTTQVTGQLASGNVNGLGALALLNTVDLNTQTTGALNGQTQVTNLGSLAYANAIAANQIGAGTLAAGVIYAGDINANNITSGTLTGRTIRTTASGQGVVMETTGTYANQLVIYGPSGNILTRLSSTGDYNRISGSAASNGTALDVENTASGSGTGLRVKGHNAGEFVGNNRGVYASANGVGAFAGYFTATNTNSCAIVANGVLRLTPTNSFPSDKTMGNLIFHTTHGLCAATGVDWRTASSWVVVG